MMGPKPQISAYSKVLLGLLTKGCPRAVSSILELGHCKRHWEGKKGWKKARYGQVVHLWFPLHMHVSKTLTSRTTFSVP